MSQRYLGGVITANPTSPTTTTATGVWTLEQQFQNDANWPKSSAVAVSRSVRFRASASAYFGRTPASATNRQTWTWSGWVKRGAVSGGARQGIFSVGGNSLNNLFRFGFDTNDSLFIDDTQSSATVLSLSTTSLYRDPSSWYHLVLAIDTTQSTSTNRVKLYVNGVQVTAFASSTYPTQGVNTYVNTATISDIGRMYNPPTSAFVYLDGYQTEVNFIDGQALDPTYFGFFDSTGIWQPSSYTGQYGTNGFYLNFSDNSAATAAAIGKDYSGNGNNWTPNNISVTAGATYDSMLDVPVNYADGGNGRGNYAVLNPVYKSFYQPTISNANLTVAGNVVNYQNAFSSIGVTSGKWYCEILVTGTPNSANMIGVSNQTQLNYLTVTADVVGAATGVGYGYYIYNGNKYSSGTSTAYGNSIASGDVVGIALDLDNGKIWFSKNGTWQASGDPVAGTNAAFSSIASDVWSIGSSSYSTGASSFSHNFGQRPFTYTPPTGFVALNTQNLPAPTISNGANYMAATTYTGNGTSQTITNAGGFAPDLVWIKGRSYVDSHTLFDTVRGATQSLSSNTTTAEVTRTTALTAFTSTGFTVSSDTLVNYNANTLVGWQWKAGGTAVSNTAGSITSSVSANPTAGFSVVTYTGTGANATVGHGLGVAPKMIIVKDRGGINSWFVQTSTTGASAYLLLNGTAASATDVTVWNATAPTSTVFSVGTNSAANQSTRPFVAYCFSEVAGFSKFGSYTGNGSADGRFVYCGFRPRYLMLKRTDTLGYDWFVLDSARNTYNVANNYLFANSSVAEGSSFTVCDFLSNGFKFRDSRGDWNGSGGTYIFMAFAENPFKTSRAR